MKVKNAMQMQLMVQRQLHDQLEMKISPFDLKSQCLTSYEFASLDSKELAVENRKTTKETYEDTKNCNSGMRFKDALQMQLAIQRQLHEQLEIQRNLLFRVEEQTKKLKKMFDQHQQDKSNKSYNLEIESAHDDHDSHES
ncbi:hypothetical protein L1987_30247 [Smallanthus sonchifolius]|uniref:Uncharacterized protein n=1 Tax=Smallanthus sonchifolius TaxID=185202 RepID=A0ACB9I3S8_9ASTR|nr:hypothetical protein L1987_30247 [Smallanthus sonchifolius]